MEKWQGKIAVVTGASAGIGAATALALCREGVHVAALARRKDRLEELAAKTDPFSGKIYPVECDVRSQESVEAAFTWIDENLGGLDILVNNAGLLRRAHVFDSAVPNENFLETIETNLSGLLLVTRRAYATMQEREFGYIININSVAGQISTMEEVTKFGFNVYGPSKHAVKELTRVMKIELGMFKKNIRITSISPGFTATDIDMVAKFTEDGSRFWNYCPHLEPEDIADQVIHCLSSKPTINITELTIEAASADYEKI